MRLPRTTSKISSKTVSLSAYRYFLCLRRSKNFTNRPWKRSSFLAFSAFALIASTSEARAEMVTQQIGTGNPTAGKEKSDSMRCQECHGADGNSSDERIPNHAGQYAGYLIKQLHDFQSGERKHETMAIMAEDLNEADISDIAAYFASQEVMHGEGRNDNPVAKKLFINGDKSRGIPACISCHAENGKGKYADNIVYPVIGGQRRVYLRSQLVNWQLGERTNSPDGVMNKIGKLLSDDEIDALANYISDL